MTQVLYCGDDQLGGAARYLAAALRRHRISFHHVESHQAFKASFLKNKYKLFILSDYPSRNFKVHQMHQLAGLVAGGRSLLMIGGWGTFTGVDGRYGQTPIGKILPVQCLSGDDRVQGAQSYRARRRERSPFMKKFDFSRSPGLCGYNRARARKHAQTVLDVETVRFNHRSRRYQVIRRDPLLVLGAHRKGLVGAFTTDLAPHWAGGFVDWGHPRVALRNGREAGVEIGTQYLKFIGALIRLFL